MNDILTKIVAGKLEDAIFNKIIGLNLGISNSVLRAIVSRVAETTSVEIVRDVTKSTNQTINTTPSNLIGIKNPVNLVNGNLGATGVNNNINNVLQVNLSSILTDRLVSELENTLKRSLPPNTRNIINFEGLAGTLAQLLTPTVSSITSDVIGSTVSGIFGKGISLPSLTKGIDSIFSKSPTSALSDIQNTFSRNQTSKYLNQAQTFNVNSPENQEKLLVTKVGFTDPTANYPTKEYAGKSETNKLAQGDVRGTIVQAKNRTRLVGAKLPGGESWDQPEAPFKGEYPYNKVTQTESGHIIEIDDTPGAERLHIYHRSGTFIEIDSNGSVVKRTAGSSYEIIDRNGKISIAGKADISVNGACNIYVGNDANIEVEGDTNLTCHNDITAQAGGTFNLSAVEEFNISSANVNIEAYNSMNVKSNATLSMSCTNNFNLRSNTNFHVQSTNLYQNTTLSYNETLSNLYEKIGGSRFSESVGATDFKGGGNFNVDYNNVYLNSGTASSSQPSKSANVAGPSNIGILSGRRDIVSVDLKDPVAVTLADTYALNLEEEPQSAEDYNRQKDLIVLSGFATSVEFATKPIQQEIRNVTTVQTVALQPNSLLRNETELPGNYNLSPNFTVEMLSSKAILTKEFIETDGNFKYGDIIVNLQALALNILEPAYNLYPTLQVMSGYRSRLTSQATSLHPKGQAVDISFKGDTPEEFYEKAVQLAQVLNYDQFILEYCNYTKAPWLHISYVGANNRKQVLTFWNNKRHSTGLARLA